MATIVQKKTIEPIFLFKEIEYLVTPKVFKHGDYVQMILDEESKKGLGRRTVFPEKIPTALQGALSGTKPMLADILFDTYLKENKELLGIPYLLALLKDQRYMKSFFHEIRSLEILDMNILLQDIGQWYSVCLKKQDERVIMDISEYVGSDKSGEIFVNNVLTKKVFVNKSTRVSPSSIRFLVSPIEQKENPLQNKIIG